MLCRGSFISTEQQLNSGGFLPARLFARSVSWPHVSEIPSEAARPRRGARIFQYRENVFAQVGCQIRRAARCLGAAAQKKGQTEVRYLASFVSEPL